MLIDLKSYTQMADFGDFRFPYRFDKLYSVESDFLIYRFETKGRLFFLADSPAAYTRSVKTSRARP